MQPYNTDDNTGVSPFSPRIQTSYPYFELSESRIVTHTCPSPQRTPKQALTPIIPSPSHSSTPKGAALTMRLVSSDFRCHVSKSSRWHCALGQKSDGGNMTCAVASYNPPADASKVIEGYPGRLPTRSAIARRPAVQALTGGRRPEPRPWTTCAPRLSGGTKKRKRERRRQAVGRWVGEEMRGTSHGSISILLHMGGYRSSGKRTTGRDFQRGCTRPAAKVRM